MIIDLKQLTYEQKKQFNQILPEIKFDLEKLQSDCFERSDKSIDWLLNNVLGRNNFHSELFMDLAYIKLVISYIEKTSVDKIIVYSVSLYTSLLPYCASAGVKIENKSTASRWKIKEYFYFIIRCLFLFLKKRRKRVFSLPKDRELTLIDVYMLQNSFDEGVFKDRYYNGMLDCLTQEERSSIYLMPNILPLLWCRNINNIMQNSSEKFIFLFDYLKLSDYLYAIFTPFRIRKINWKEVSFNGVNISAILDKTYYDSFNSYHLYSFLILRFFSRLKKDGVKLRTVVDWYENQACDKALSYAVRKEYPDTVVKGYIGAIADSDYCSHMYPSSLEIQQSLVPHKIYVCGASLVREYKVFNSQIAIDVAPFFRCLKIWNVTPSVRTDTSKKFVLVPLDISLSDVKRKSYFLSHLIPKLGVVYKFYIKPHPATDEVVIREFFPSSLNIEIVNGDIYNFFKLTDILIGLNSTTTVEAFALNIPILFYCDDTGVCANPIPRNIKSDNVRIAFCVDDAVKYIKEFSATSVKKDQDIYERKKLLFEPFSREKVTELLC